MHKIVCVGSTDSEISVGGGGGKLTPGPTPPSKMPRIEQEESTPGTPQILNPVGEVSMDGEEGLVTEEGLLQDVSEGSYWVNKHILNRNTYSVSFC